MMSRMIVDPTQVRKLTDIGQAVKMTDKEIADLQAKFKMSEAPTPDKVNADNDPSKRYAVLTKNGEVIATFYTSGLMESSNSAGAPENLSLDGHGISLANIRIKQMQEINGGTIEYIQNTQTAARSRTSETLMTAQILGQQSTTSNKFYLLFETFVSASQKYNSK